MSLSVGEGGIGQAGDVGTARADVNEAAWHGAHEAAAGDADDAHVERADVGFVAADAGVGHRRAAVADDADVGGGAADLEVEPIRHAQMHERAGDAGGGA